MQHPRVTASILLLTTISITLETVIIIIMWIIITSDHYHHLVSRIQAGDAEDERGVAEAEHVEGGLWLGELSPPNNDIYTDSDDDAHD